MLILQHSSYKSLQPRTRVLFGLGIMANAALALQFSDQIEAFLGMTPTQSEEQRLKDSLPKVTTIDKKSA